MGLSLPSFFSDLRSQGLALWILNAIGAAESGSDSRKGYAGFVGSTLIIFAFLSLMWGSLSPTTDKTLWLYFLGAFVGGLAISMAFGFSLTRKVSMRNEMNASLLGLAAGSVMLIVNLTIFTVSDFVPYATYGESLWLVMLAPVAETLAVDVAIYHWFMKDMSPIPWMWIAVASDATFALFHYFRYGLHPDFFLILAVLVIGNTIFIYLYDRTKNATAPMVAHTMVNFATAPAAVLAALEGFFILFLVIFTIILFIYIIRGGKITK